MTKMFMSTMADVQRLNNENKSLYNSTADTLQRLNDYQKFIAMARVRSDYQSMTLWLSILKIFDCELSPYCTDEEKKKIEDTRVDQIHNYNGRLWLRAQPIYYKRLDEYERLLKELFVKKGMGIISKEIDNIHMIG